MHTNDTAHDTAFHIAIDHHDGAPLAPDDPRVAYLRAAQTAAAVVQAVRSEHLSLDTPCADWTVADLAGHVAAVVDRVAAAPTGTDLSTLPIIVTTEPSAIPAAIGAALERAHATWTDEALGQIIDAPWGPTPGGLCLGIWASELLVHAWDLATSIGASVDWPEPDVTLAAQHTRAGVPATRDDQMPFGPVVDVGPAAAPIERLVGWLGRDPSAPRSR